jgi:hypothetical protein
MVLKYRIGRGNYRSDSQRVTYNRDRHICRLDLLLWVSPQPAKSGKRGAALCISYDFMQDVMHLGI